MKKSLYYIFLLLLFSSCMKTPAFQSYPVNLTVSFDDEVPVQDRDSIKVSLTNLTKNYSKAGYTDANGKVSFSNVEPGFYSASLTHSFIANGGKDYLNGRKNIDVFSAVNDTIPTVLSKSNAVIIKEFYYSGCLTPAGKYYSSDQYIELYNNSPIVQYLDGMSIVEDESYATGPYYFSFVKDTIVVRMIWSFPGSGKDYPINPGQNIVIARDAINHRSDPNGNPLSPVNLGKAEFEFYVYSVSGGDFDSPTAVNMIEDLFTFRGSDVVFHTRGGSAIALVKIPGDSAERKKYINNHLIAKIGSNRYYGKIPDSYVIDGVEVTWDEAHAIYKRLPVEIDAGYTYVSAGSHSGKCIRRKVKEVVKGRFIYQDTNNSCNDFLKDATPKPWVNEW